ncbi:nuclear transport factor 2 family protein [Deminuibacter soli]|uniref:Nuclear transport factor 2 family protein n=1 Tax=Deminuibacter soli TaxID=2291815 RepID=A0A3E1NIU7_9BACT|nr:nuclear transport factor 2 family protein [Deminuibacter soli]RFM27859.1 nuclear transport factor 2 family protein [Deminuibacter soli]
MKNKTFAGIVFLLLLSGMAMAQSKDETAVAAAVESLRKAMIDPTKANLDQLTAPALSYGHSSGKVQGKAAFEEALLNGSSDFVSIDLTDQTISVTGNTAIVRHTLSAQTNDGGKPGAVKIGILLVWVKQQGSWKLLARQAVKLPQ